MLFWQSRYVSLSLHSDSFSSYLALSIFRLATLCGLTILSTKWDSTSYRNFGLLMIPYFVFDAYFYSIGALSTLGAVGDGGNIAIQHYLYTL